MAGKKSGPQCQCCAHPRSAELDRDVVRGLAVRAVARNYGLKSDAVHRHVRNHLTEERRREIAVYLKRERAQAVATACARSRLISTAISRRRSSVR